MALDADVIKKSKIGHSKYPRDAELLVLNFEFKSKRRGQKEKNVWNWNFNWIFTHFFFLIDPFPKITWWSLFNQFIFETPFANPDLISLFIFKTQKIENEACWTKWSRVKCLDQCLWYCSHCCQPWVKLSALACWC